MTTNSVPPRSRWDNRWVLRACLFAGGVGGLTVFARIEDTEPRVLPTVLFVGAVVGIVGLISDASGSEPADWSPPAEYAATSAGQDAGLAGSARLLENHLSARAADPLLRARLARMTDDRLSRLGLSRADPGVDRRLGPTLTGVLDGPPRRLRPAEIEECVRRIEELTP
jgi:hypothetical protein